MESKHETTNSTYDARFFDEIMEGSLSSARVIAPLLIELAKPASVLDVGCAEGAWLSVFRDLGIRDYLGIDGDYVDKNRLLIEKDRFLSADLGKGFKLNRSFDLAICLEVGEHLPADAADQIVACLVRHAKCIAFSASIPFQDGTNHINEQWPDYWVNLFREHGYEAIDCIRPRIWKDNRVRWWFAQNTIIYCDPKYLSSNKMLCEAAQRFGGSPLSVVHPELFSYKEKKIKMLLEKNRALADLETKTKSRRWLVRQLANGILGKSL